MLFFPQAIQSWQGKVESLGDDIQRVIFMEREERAIRKAEMEATKMQNLLEHEDEIRARPARTWFQTEREKKDVARRAKVVASGLPDPEEVRFTLSKVAAYVYLERCSVHAVPACSPVFTMLRCGAHGAGMLLSNNCVHGDVTKDKPRSRSQLFLSLNQPLLLWCRWPPSARRLRRRRT